MLRFNLDSFQERAFWECVPGTIATYPWGRGAGKTFLGRALIHSQAFTRQGIHVGLLMPTLKQARQVFWPGLLADFEGPLRKRIHGRPNRTLLEATYENGSRLTTWGAENAGGIRGQRFDVIIEDETDDIAPEVEQAVVRPTFSRSGVNALWVKFGTPRRGRAGSLFGSFNRAQRKQSRYTGFALRSCESPQVDQAWLDGVKDDTPPDIYAREYDVNFDAAGGRVYGDVFNEKFHVRIPPEETQWTEILIGADHGWEDPGCLLLIGVLGSGRDAVAWVLDEIYERHRADSWWVDALKPWTEWYPRHKFYGDPSRPGLVEDYRKLAHARVQEVDNAIEDGLAAVADRFLIRGRYDDKGELLERYARLYIHPRCVNTLTELGATVAPFENHKPLDGIGPYMRKKDPLLELRYLEEIVDRNNHAMDALRYPILNRFGKPLSQRNAAPYDARS